MRYIQPLTAEQRALLDKTMRDDPSFRARSRAHSRSRSGYENRNHAAACDF